MLVTAATSLAAGSAFLHLVGGTRPGALDWVRTVLFVVAGFWLLWGGLVGLLGALSPPRRPGPASDKPHGMTAILVPIYNEDPVETFARIAAMNRQLVMAGAAESFHFAILSDTSNAHIAAHEVLAYESLMHEPAAAGRIFYRRREKNVGRKAGNIEDFVVRSGAAYDYAIILDADSLMEGATMIAMTARMAADPRLGLLQTVPTIIGARSLFGRLMAFSAAYLSPYFSRGAALIQGHEGPYWGHNAIVRVRAFAQCCGLPTLSGRPPHGGHILSHDYVEAALLARGGWKVEVDPTLTGSYEHGPDNLVEYVKRDRRWCQGNLQHRRLIGAPRLKLWSRFTFVQGIMAYLVSPIWLLLLLATIVATAYPDGEGERLPFVAWLLGWCVASALLLPKLAIVIRGALDGTNRRFGGTLRVIGSVLCEIVLTTLMAPILLAFQSRAVIQILFGLDGGWPATERDAQIVPLKTATEASWWIALAGFGILAFMALQAPRYLLWLLPIGIPAILAPVIIWATSHGARLRAPFANPTEHRPTPVLIENERVLSGWAGPRLPHAHPAYVSGLHASA